MLKEIFKYMHNYKKYVIIASLCVIFETTFELIIPMMMADIIDVGVSTRDTTYILYKGLQMMGCAFISLLLGLLYARFAAIAAQGFGAELRKHEFEKVQQFSFANLDHFETSSLVTRLTNDVTVMQNAVANGLRPLVRSPLMLLMGLIAAFYLNAKLAIVFLVCMPLLGICLFLIIRKVAPMYAKLQQAIDRVNLIVQENLIAIRVVKSYVRHDYEQEKFTQVNENLQHVSQRTFHFAALNMPCFQLIVYSAIVLILWFGGKLIFIGDMKVGELTGFLSYVLQIMNSLMMISNVFLMLVRSLASASRIQEVFQEESDIKDDQAGSALIQHGNIDFDHVYFKYSKDAQEYVLSDINLHIEAGQTIGLIGGTGSAKSTLVSLIPRLYDISSGSLRIDSMDIKSLSLVHLRDAVAMVLQKNTLFSGTIKENLLWGNERASEEDIDWACHIACVDEFLNQFPQGYDTDLGQGGVNVSGGQKQRLCIARALLKHPRVLIFDDSTSAVDTATESSIREGLAGLKDVTKIIIAQRVTSIMHADQIVILEDGRIQDIGNHEELLQHNAIYQDLYRSQQEGVSENG